MLRKHTSQESSLDTRVPTKMWIYIKPNSTMFPLSNTPSIKTKEKHQFLTPQMKSPIIILSMIQKSHLPHHPTLVKDSRSEVVSMMQTAPGMEPEKRALNRRMRALKMWSEMLIVKPMSMSHERANVHHKICFETKWYQIHSFLLHVSFTMQLWCKAYLPLCTG